MVKFADTKKQSVRPNNSLIPGRGFDENSHMPHNFRHSPYAPQLMYAEPNSMMNSQYTNQLYQQNSMVPNMSTMEQYSNYNMQHTNSHQQMNMKGGHKYMNTPPMNMLSAANDNNFDLNAARSSFQSTRPPEGEFFCVCLLLTINDS